MTVKAHIEDGCLGTNQRAAVTANGQVVTSPYAYDDVVFQELAEDDTAYKFYDPKADKQLVITGIIAKADKQVSTTVDAVVVIYEASSADTTTVDKTLFQFAMVSGDSLTLLPLNIIVNQGKFVLGKTSDDDIHVTVTGYYIP